MGLLLDRGQRGLLVGRTGSGKSANAYFQLRHPKVWPVIMFDTKIEDEFFGVPQEGDSLELVESLDAFDKLAKRPKNKMPDYILVRPGIDEMQDHEYLDQYARLAYEKFGPVFLYFDELYSWHNNGRVGNNMTAILTRGRSKGKTFLGTTQRPSWISRFFMTEADKFYIHQLTDERDKSTLANVIPGLAKLPDLPEYHFYHYNVKKPRDGIMPFAPVPYKPPAEIKVDPIQWI